MRPAWQIGQPRIVEAHAQVLRVFSYSDGPREPEELLVVPMLRADPRCAGAAHSVRARMIAVLTHISNGRSFKTALNDIKRARNPDAVKRYARQRCRVT